MDTFFVNTSPPVRFERVNFKMYYDIIIYKNYYDGMGGTHPYRNPWHCLRLGGRAGFLDPVHADHN
jgi:hypothetical protein